MATALILSLMLMASTPAPGAPAAPPAPAADPEPMPLGAPTEDYQLTAWCYGALGEWLAIYDVVRPDLADIDRQFGTTVKEDEPYKDDIAAARIELRKLGRAVTAAEKASARPISDRGVAALRQGRDIWAQAEARSHRELARAWLSWGLPDKCASVSTTLEARASLLGHALTYNAGTALDLQAEEEAPPPSARTASAAPVAPSPEPARMATRPQPAVAEAAPPEPAPSAPPPVREAVAAPEPQPQAAPAPSRVMDATEPTATAAAAPAPAVPTPQPAVAPTPTPASASDQSQEPTL